jgi:hypothetical protein
MAPAPPLEPPFLPVERIPARELSPPDPGDPSLSSPAKASGRPVGTNRRGAEDTARQLRAEATAMIERDQTTRNRVGETHLPAVNPYQIERALVPNDGGEPKPLSTQHLRDLPPEVRNRLPEIRLSLHLYAAEPSSRKIRIGGRTITEGEIVSGELAVARITRDGVIFRFHDQLFFLGALESWRGRDGS